MIRVVFAVGAVWLGLLVSAGAVDELPRHGVDWPSFRGQRASGVADGFSTPTKWNIETGQGVLWKTPIPGLGHSSPVIWRDRLCITTAVASANSPGIQSRTIVADASVHKWQVICLDKASGKLVWAATAHKAVPSINRHESSTHANATLATDGTHLVAFFGTEGLYCYRLSDGRLLWRKKFGLLDFGYFKHPPSQWAGASSPIIHEGRVILLCDVQKGAFLTALSIKDGKEIWRTPRNDVPSWATPTILEEGGRAQIVTNGWREIAGYDFNSGKQIWRMNASERGGDLPVPTPVVGRGLIFITNDHGPGAPIYGIRTNARGDISLKADTVTNQYVAWSTSTRLGSYISTPLLYGEYLYSLKTFSVLGVYEPLTGVRLYQQRIGRSAIWASPVAGDGKVYFTGVDGDVAVVKAGGRFELLAENSLEDSCWATPAISEGNLYFRTRGHVIAIGATGHGQSSPVS